MTNVHFNPLREVQSLLSNPALFNSCILSFSNEQVAAALSFFKSPIRTVGKFRNPQHIPQPIVPEVCFFGASNVGKSSLIQKITADCQSSPNIGVSKKPGFTKSVNLYHIGSRLAIVDLPGYGINAPKAIRTRVEPYLRSERRNMKLLCLLMDASVDITDDDFQAMQILNTFEVPYTLVLTKYDIAHQVTVLNNVLRCLDVINNDKENVETFPFLVSSLDGTGIDLLKTYIYVKCIQSF